MMGVCIYQTSSAYAPPNERATQCFGCLDIWLNVAGDENKELQAAGCLIAEGLALQAYEVMTIAACGSPGNTLPQLFSFPVVAHCI